MYMHFFTGDNEERSMIEPRSYDDPKLKELIEILVEWINDTLAPERIIVKDIEEDLYDGMVFHKLIGEAQMMGGVREREREGTRLR